jgi:hypothetical protein
VAGSDDLSPADQELLRSIAEIKTNLHLLAVKENLELHLHAVEQIGKVVLVVAGGAMTADDGIRQVEKIIEPLEEPTRMVRDFIESLK